MNDGDDERTRGAVSRRYLGSAGRDYYNRFQRTSARRGAPILASRFSPHVRPDDFVVEFGCGGGFLLGLIEAREKVGIEVNDAARSEAFDAGLQVRRDLSEVGSRSADVVMTNHALEHTLDPYSQLREMLRILKPGGRLVLVVPIGDWRAERNVRADDRDGHLFSWTPQNMYNLLTEVGFDDVEAEVISFAWPPRVDLLSKIGPLFELSGRLWSILRRRRELMATASAPIGGDR